jgi:hypothetical protein
VIVEGTQKVKEGVVVNTTNAAPTDVAQFLGSQSNAIPK